MVPGARVGPVNQIRSRMETVGREERDVIWQGPNDLIDQTDSLSLVQGELGVISDLGDMDHGRGKSGNSEIVHLVERGVEGPERTTVSIVEPDAYDNCTDVGNWCGNFCENGNDMGYACPRIYIDL